MIRQLCLPSAEHDESLLNDGVVVVVLRPRPLVIAAIEELHHGAGVVGRVSRIAKSRTRVNEDVDKTLREIKVRNCIVEYMDIKNLCEAVKKAFHEVHYAFIPKHGTNDKIDKTHSSSLKT